MEANVSKIMRFQHLRNIKRLEYLGIRWQCIKSSVKSELLTIISFAKNRFYSLYNRKVLT